MFRRAAGACMPLFACALTCEPFVQRMPETANRSALPASLPRAGLFHIGAHWIRGRGLP